MFYALYIVDSNFMKSRHLSKMLAINNRYLNIERYTLEDSEDDLDDFFDKFHERYRVVES